MTSLNRDFKSLDVVDSMTIKELKLYIDSLLVTSFDERNKKSIS